MDGTAFRGSRISATQLPSVFMQETTQGRMKDILWSRIAHKTVRYFQTWLKLFKNNKSFTSSNLPASLPASRKQIARKFLNIYHKKCREQRFKYYAPYTFPVRLAVFDVTEQKWANVREQLRYAYITCPALRCNLEKAEGLFNAWCWLWRQKFILMSQGIN